VKLVSAAESAEPCRIDALGINAQCQQLAPVGFLQIDVGALIQILPLRKQFSELHRHFRTDLIAAGADRRSKGGVQVRRTCPPTCGHGLHRLLHDPSNRSSPARMHGRDGSMMFIDEKNWQAVRSLDAYQSPVR